MGVNFGYGGYGMMNGAKVLDDALKSIEEFHN